MIKALLLYLLSLAIAVGVTFIVALTYSGEDTDGYLFSLCLLSLTWNIYHGLTK